MARSRFISNPLLGPEEAKEAAPDKREKWVNAARKILKSETQEQLDARPLSDRLSLAAASYGFWIQDLGDPQFKEGEWAKLKAVANHLPPEKQKHLADDLELQVKALKSLKVDEEYFRMEDRVFNRAYEVFLQEPGVKQGLQDWGKAAAENFLIAKTGLLEQGTMEKYELTRLMTKGQLDDLDRAGVDYSKGLYTDNITEAARKTLDAAGITHEKIVGIMNAASAAVCKAWTEEMATHAVSDKPLPMRVEGAAEAERSIEFNVLTDDKGNNYYKMGPYNPSALDPRGAMHVAFHEPQHHIQNRIGALLERGEDLPDYMKSASQIFRLLGNFGMKNCPPDVFDIEGNTLNLKEIAYNAYKLSRGEETALYQGNRASVEINHDFLPAIRPKIEAWLDVSPALEQGMPEKSRKWVEAVTGEKVDPLRKVPKGPVAA